MVKRLCTNDERPWKFIPLSLLSNVGDSLLFQCNYNIQYLPLNENSPKFYRDIISHWQKIKNINPKTKGDVLNQTNMEQSVCSSKQVICFFPGWNKFGIEKLSCLFDNEGNTLLSFTTFMQKYNIKCNFLQYYNLLSAIPQEWKTMLKLECFLPSTEYVTLSIERSHAKQFTILYPITSTSLLQLQRKDSLNMALTFKKDKNILTSFSCYK